MSRCSRPLPEHGVFWSLPGALDLRSMTELEAQRQTFTARVVKVLVLIGAKMVRLDQV